MNKRVFLPALVAFVISSVSAVAQPLLYSDAMESGSGWQYSHFGGTHVPTGADTSAASFGFDYSSRGIPEAPNSSGADAPTTGLRLATNIDGLWAGDQMAVVYEDASFAGQYTLQVDVWLNWSTIASGVGTTEHAGVFAGFNLTDAQYSFAPGLNGAGVVYSSDGDASCGVSGSTCDYALAKDGAELDLSSGQYSDIAPIGNTLGLNNTLDALETLFPSFDISSAVSGSNGSGTQPAGALGFQWVTVTIEVDAIALGSGTGSALGTADISLFSHRSGSTLHLGTIDNSVVDDPFDNIDTQERPVGLEGGIGLSIIDYFQSGASDAGLAFALFDNVRVFDGLLSNPLGQSRVAVPEPSGVVLMFAAIGWWGLRNQLLRLRGCRWRRVSVLLVIAAVLGGLPRSAHAVLSLTANFDHGSLLSWGGDVNNVSLVGRENYPGTSGWRWMYFEATGVSGAQTVFNVDQAFAGGNSALNSHRMVYSYDNENWQFFDNNQRSGNNYTFSNNSPFAEDTVWVAYAQPYSYQKSVEHTAAVLATPWAMPTVSGDSAGVIGKTPIAVDDVGRLNPARDIYAYRITNPATDSASPKRKIVITTGLHAGEVLGTHTYEGMVNWLVSDDIRAARLRDIAEVFAYPTLNAAGRFAGTSRATVENPNQDPNGLWNPSLWATHQDIRVSGEAMLADTQSTPGTTVEAFIDFHSTIPTATGDDFGFIEISEGDADAEWWQELLTLQPNVQQVESTGTSWTTANFADLLLNADVDVTFETEFGNNRPISYYHQLGENFGIAFFNAWVPQVEGDYNNDGVVTLADFAVWRDNHGADIALPNEDPAATPGQVTSADYDVWKQNFGAIASAAVSSLHASSVPEPAAAWMVVLAALFFASRRKRPA